MAESLAVAAEHRRQTEHCLSRLIGTAGIFNLRQTRRRWIRVQSIGLQMVVSLIWGQATPWASADAAPGLKQLLVTATDGSGTGQNTIVLNVTKTGVEIVDNADFGASTTGAWGTSTWAPGYYGTNYSYHDVGAGTDTFTWAPFIAVAGSYHVYARWTQDPSRADDATYTIYHNTGSTDVVVDQRSNGGAWYLLGTFSLDGSGDKVELGQRASGIVIADAVRFEAQ